MLPLLAKAVSSNGDRPKTQIPSDVIAPAFDELSPDLRYKILQRRARGGMLFNASCLLVAVALLAPVAVPQLNSALDSAIATARGLKRKADTAAEFISPDFASPIQEGEQIAGYTVTSGYGLRDTTNLPAGASADHKGVDLATPEGTPIRAIGEKGSKTKVRCWRDADGGGLVAEIEPDSFPGERFQALHLESCKTGIYKTGEEIARTGDTGIGDPHLDWRQRERSTGKHQHPQKSYLLWALTGREPNANFTRIDILRNAIITQESSGDAAIVNKDSGALGYGQVLPENLAGEGKGWDFEALGRDLTPDEFLADPDAQTRIINHQLSTIYEMQIAEGHSDDEATRRTAAEWYSGQADKADDTAVQYWDGDPSKAYPSIKDYSDEVLNRVHQLRLDQLNK